MTSLGPHCCVQSCFLGQGGWEALRVPLGQQGLRAWLT